MIRLIKGAWEMLAYELAITTGISMVQSKIEKIAGNCNTFFIKRFDREKAERIHLASAMTMTEKSEETIKDLTPSYLDMADFIQNYGAKINDNLEQLWRRIIFNIAVSNTDDDLRNHRFLLTDEGWILSPAHDINPSIDKNGLALNIDTNNNELDFDLAKSVGEYLRLDDSRMDDIINEVLLAVGNWKKNSKKTLH